MLIESLLHVDCVVSALHMQSLLQSYEFDMYNSTFPPFTDTDTEGQEG